MKFNQEYKNLVKHILENGTDQEGRNGGTRVVPHYSFTVDSMKEDHELLLRKMWYKGVKGEFDTLMSLEPLTNVDQFKERHCNYWDMWGNEYGDINLDYYNMLHPQFELLAEEILENPTSRRLHLELWNWENVRNGSLSLPCCWHGLTFSVIDNTLHMKWSQRSVDVALGLPADVYLAYLFMKRMSKLTELEIGSCMFSLSNVHLYSKHLGNAKELLTRTAADHDKTLSFELIA